MKKTLTLKAAVQDAARDVRRVMRSSLVGKTWVLSGYPHAFTVLAISVNGQAHVREGGKQRLVPADLLVAAKCRGMLTEVPSSRSLEKKK